MEAYSAGGFLWEEDRLRTMANAIERTPINRLYLWCALMWLIGLSIGLSSITSLLTGDGGIFDWVMIVAGVSILVATGWETAHRDSAEFSASGYWFAVLIFCALLAVGGSVFSVIALF